MPTLGSQDVQLPMSGSLQLESDDSCNWISKYFDASVLSHDMGNLIDIISSFLESRKHSTVGGIGNTTDETYVY